MKQKLKRFMAGFMAVLTMVMTLFTNGSTAFAASPQIRSRTAFRERSGTTA